MRVAGIVVYNPDYERLNKNINAIYNQVDILVVYQNSKINCEKIQLESEIVFFGKGENAGIAKALNSIMSYAKSKGATWCLLLDQDSIVCENYLNICEKYTKMELAGIITPNVVDEYDNDIQHKNMKNSCDSVETVDMCITSGSYNNIEIWESTGKFREEFFIDYVDWEYCVRLRNKGYKIYKLNKLLLNHELGKRSYHTFFGREFYSFNHNAFRKYYITRNTIITYWLYPNEKKLAHPYLRTIKRIMITLLYESDKSNKVKAIVQGIVDSRKLFKVIQRAKR